MAPEKRNTEQRNARKESQRDDRGRMRVELAISAADIEQSFRLRHQVFIEEMGARNAQAAEGRESDRFDAFCHHLVVRDEDSDRIVACTRILTDTQAKVAGGFYSDDEFDLDAIRQIPGRIMEVGRTCVHPDYRSGATISTLWTGLARFMDINRFGHMIGCASIPMHDGGVQARQIMDKLRPKYLSADDQRVYPSRGLPTLDGVAAASSTEELRMPPLLKAYMRLGARICGEPCWDPDFNTADVFILLDCDKLQQRYVRHFVERRGDERSRSTVAFAA